MPTETVYGLAADALNPVAVRSVFAAKSRPADNPLIVHVHSVDEVESIAAERPDSMLQLAKAFWPGPLTMVLPKRRDVPSEVTGGGNTVAVRVPAHPVALELLREVGGPICAPSANAFMALSPTRAEDVNPDLPGFAILDGGPCQIGIESTVLDLTSGQPKLLRKGVITADAIGEVLGLRVETGDGDGEKKSPGNYPRHYAPQTPLVLVDCLAEGQPGLGFEGNFQHQRTMPREPLAYARELYSALHDLDRLGFETIFVERPPTTPEWAAVWDRLTRASGVL